MANIKYNYIYDNDSLIFSFKKLQLFETYPGINAKIYKAEDNIFYINDLNIEESYSSYDEHIVEILNQDKVFNIELFGIMTGTSVLKTDFCKEEFVFYIFSAYHRSLNRWLINEDLKQLEHGNLKILPFIDIVDNNYEAMKQVILNRQDIYGILFKPEPDAFTDKLNQEFVSLYLNPIYQEDIIKYAEIPSYVIKDLQAELEVLLDKKLFRNLLVSFCIEKQFSSLDHLRWEDLKEIQEFIIIHIYKQKANFNERVFLHESIFHIMTKLRIREWFLDFLKKKII